MKSSDVGRTIARGVEKTADEIGKEMEFCVGGRCCGRGTYYDHKKGACVPEDGSGAGSGDDSRPHSSAEDRQHRRHHHPHTPSHTHPGSKEGFDTEYMTQTSYVESPPPICPWKKVPTTVRAFDA